jgi:hypothetical protein
LQLTHIEDHLGASRQHWGDAALERRGLAGIQPWPGHSDNRDITDLADSWFQHSVLPCARSRMITVL